MNRHYRKNNEICQKITCTKQATTKKQKMNRKKKCTYILDNQVPLAGAELPSQSPSVIFSIFNLHLQAFVEIPSIVFDSPFLCTFVGIYSPPRCLVIVSSEIREIINTPRPPAAIYLLSSMTQPHSKCFGTCSMYRVEMQAWKTGFLEIDE